MPLISLAAQDDRATFASGSSATFQITGNPGEALLPGARLCGRVLVSGTGNPGTVFLPTTGVHALIRSVYVSSSMKSGLVNIMDYFRLAAVAKAATRPEDRISMCHDLSSPSLTVSRGIFSQQLKTGGGPPASVPAPLPFALSLEHMSGGLLSQPLSFDRLGTIQIQVTFANAAEGTIQDAGNSDSDFVISELSLCYDVAPAPALAAVPLSYIRPEVQRVAADVGRVNIVLPPTETLVAAAVVFQRDQGANPRLFSNATLEAPPGLTSVRFTMDGSALQQFDVTVSDLYAAQTQTDFLSALSVLFPSMLGDSVASRPSAEALIWRTANADANGGSRAIAIGGCGVEDAYGLGVILPPAGDRGSLSVQLNWDFGATPYVAHVILGFLKAA